MATQSWTKERIATLSSGELQSILRSTNPTGAFAGEVVWAREELKRRDGGSAF